MAAELENDFIIDEDPEEALTLAMQKQDASRQKGDELGRALGMIKAGDALASMGKSDDAIDSAMEAMALCGEMKFEEGKAAAMNVMSKAYLKRGRDVDELEEALDSAMDTLKLFRKLGYRKGEAVALMTLADVHHQMRSSAASVQHAKEALAIFSERGEKRSMAVMHTKIANGYLVKSPPDTSRASKAMAQAQEIYEQLQDRSKAAMTLHTAGKIELNGGDSKKAVESITKSKELFAACGNIQGQAMAMETLMNLHLDAGMYTEAVRIGKDVCQVFSNVGDKQGEANAMVKIGRIMLAHQDHDSAGRMAEAAVAIYSGMNNKASLADATELLDAAKDARTAEEISLALNKCSGILHIPATLVIEPGLNKKINESYKKAIAA